MRTLWILIACCAFVVLSCKNKDSSSSKGDSVKLIRLDLSKAKNDSMNLSEIGGSDIMMEIYETGELQELLK